MPVKECDPSSSFAKVGSCSPSTSHSRRVFEGLSSLLESLKYCRAKQDFHPSLVPLKELRRRGEVWPRHSSSSSSSSTSSKEEQPHKPFRSWRRRGEFEHCTLLPNSGPLSKPSFEQARSSHSTDESDEGVSDLLPLIDELNSSNSEKRRHAADKVRRLARSSTRSSMTMVKLGAISPLISMLDAPEESLQLSALLALLHLAAGTNVNKAAIVTAGAIPKLVTLVHDSGASSSKLTESIAALLLTLSALDVNKPVIGHSGAVESLIKILKQGSLRGKSDSIKALCNLAIFHGNVEVIVDADAIQSLLDMVYHPALVESAVDLLGSLAATDSGRRAIIQKQDSVLILVDVLGWNDAPECQEKAVGVLMTMAHRSRALRQTIARCGAVSALLELSMLGSSIAQKVAAWILDCLQQDEEDQRRLTTRHETEVFSCSEEPQPGRFVHKVLQQRETQDASDQFISITF